MFETGKVEEVRVVNVVASAALGQRVDLDAVIRGFSSAEFPSERFPGLVFRLKKPRTATLIFSTGKMICTGGRSEKEAKKVVDSVVGELSRGGIITPRKSKVKIANIVASANFGRDIDLESLSRLPGAMYEPDQFPALIYRMREPKVVFLIFSTGRLVCVGAKSENEVHRAVRELLQILDAVNTSPSLPHRPDEEVETKCSAYVPSGRIELRDFTSSDSQGKRCIHVSGLWCHNKYCNGPSCRFANLIQRKVVDGFYGCWGFHWQQGWHTTETKRLQRKFHN